MSLTQTTGAVLSVIRPKAPISPSWERRTVAMDTGYAATAWYHPRLKLYVISAVEKADGPGPEYHLSISKRGRTSPRRCSAEEAGMVLQQFGLEGATEDNHTSITRNFWRPVADRDIGLECDCKEHEASIVEGDFEWRPLTQANADRAKRIEAKQQEVSND